MGLVVTGISQDGNIKDLETALTGAGFSLDPVQLIGPGDSDSSLAGGIAGADLLASSGGGTGTGVPGLTSSIRHGQTFFRNESLTDRLGDLEIPDSEIDNYAEALQAGRHIVAYFAKPDTLEKVTEIFRQAGLAKVKVF